MGLRNWFSRGTDSDEQEGEVDTVSRELREFIYLDRDSVVSLLASIEGAIKEERVEQLGTSSEERISGGVNAEISGIGANIGGERVEMEEDSTEVVHNYAIQSLFDELDKHRRTDAELGTLTDDEVNEIELSNLNRSDIIRVEVELETHYLYRFYRVMRYIHENIPESVGPEDEDVLDLIESMFGTEVPVSGKVLDYHVKDNRIVPVNSGDETEDPLYIVGQLNTRKLWQDIPDALFDGEEYTIFCRVEEIYQDEEWHPLSLAQRIETVSPPLARAITHFMERAVVLAEREANNIYDDTADREKLKDSLTEFDQNSGIDAIDETYHEKFLYEYLTQGRILTQYSSGNTELISFYQQYGDYLRDQGFDLSKSDEARATNAVIFNDEMSMDDIGEENVIEGVQIESKIVAIYW